MNLRFVDLSVPTREPVEGELHGDEHFATERYLLSRLPAKIAGASAGWCRAVAIFGLEG